MAAFRPRPATLSCAALVVVIAVAAWGLAGRAADANSDWPAYSGDKASTKYSPLDQIDAATSRTCTIAWRRSAVPEELRAAVSRRAGAAPTTSTRRSSSTACST